MFDFLKKKISGLVDKIAGKKEGAPAKEPEKKPPVEKEEPVLQELIKEAPPGKKEQKPEIKTKPAEKKSEAKAPEKPKIEKPTPEPKKAPEEPRPAQKPPGPKVSAPESRKMPEKPAEVAPAMKEIMAEPPPAHTMEVKAQPPKEKKAGSVKEEKVKLSFVTQLKSVFSSEVELGENDVASALDDFEMDMLESDVALDVAEQIKAELKKDLVGKRMKKGELQERIGTIFLNSIKDIMSENTGVPLLEQVKARKERPIKIMFTGPNGSGKTTTIAKIANMLKKNGFSVVVAAADTFRAAAIEQMEIHGTRLGVKVVAGKYGADPTSVAFDAVNHAKAHNMDVVLIDTAGRQETNTNLLNELKKMVRVINPEIKVYVGESIAGNSVIEQVGAFNQELGLDGVILTKLDCDAKGGTVISISKVTRVPVLYVTVGQGYEDIQEFDAGKIAHNIAG